MRQALVALLTILGPVTAMADGLTPYGGFYLGGSRVDVQPGAQWDDPKGLDLGVIAGLRWKPNLVNTFGIEGAFGNTLGSSDALDFVGSGDLDIGTTYSVGLLAGLQAGRGSMVFLRGGYQWMAVQDEDKTSHRSNTFAGPQVAIGAELDRLLGPRLRVELVRTFYEAEDLSGVDTDLDQYALRLAYLIAF